MEKKEKTTFTLSENGPLIVSGEFSMTDSKGNEIRVTNPTYLCRCGHSKNKPFCDGMHKEKNFTG